jgi:hypothetical protein
MDTFAKFATPGTASAPPAPAVSGDSQKGPEQVHAEPAERAEGSPPPAPPVSPIPPPPRSRSLLPLIIIIVAIIAAAGYLAYRYFVLGSLLPAGAPQSSPAASAVPAASTFSRVLPVQIANPSSVLAYVRDADPETTGFEVWLIDPATAKEEKLDIGLVLEAFKHYGSSLLFYRPVSDAGNSGELRVLDLTDGSEITHTLITHPDPDAIENVYLQNITHISPDAKWLVFSADFFEPCPTPSPFPSGFEGGFGPCQPDENLAFPTGYYLYELATGQATPLPGMMRLSRWDPEGGKLYFITSNATKVLDLATKSSSTPDTSSYFGYYTYPLLSKNMLVKNEAATGDSGAGGRAFATMSLLDLATREAKEFDSVEAWAVIQPFITSSPDENEVLYLRTTHVDGYMRNAIYRYSLTSQSMSRLTPEDNSLSFSLYGAWLDDRTFVTSVNQMEGSEYSNLTNYLVQIDLDTGSVTRLTSHDLVSRFNTQ